MTARARHFLPDGIARRCLAAVVLLAAAGAGPAPAASLDEALVGAYMDNPTLEAARAELRSVDEGVPQALSNWRPNVEIEATAGKNRTENVSSFFSAEENRSPYSGTLRVEQPIFRGFRTLAETREAEHTVRAQRALLMSVEQDVLLAAVSAFVDVVAAQAVLDLNVNNVQVLVRQLEATQDRFTVGEVTRTDVSQAEARLARAEADRVGAEGDLDSSRAGYRNVVGQLPGQLEAPATPNRLPGSLDESIDLAVDNDPRVVAATFVERAARNGVDLVLGELLPTLSVRGEVSRARNTSSDGSESNRESLLATLRIPLYQSGAVTSRIREARQRASQRRLEIEVARRDAIEEATRAWEALVTAQARVVAFEAETDANRIALEGVEEEAFAGLRTVLDILDAEQELLDSQVNLVGARRDEIEAGFRVLAATGALTAQDLGLPVEIYDPNQYYESVRLRLWGLGEPLPDPE